ncbi:MAG: helix-turn-helix domain-containing protein [Lachnospiraceae bacterium]|nr:helix-turn-helix domain-containing protein [Lachnospiraceae bacterium]
MKKVRKRTFGSADKKGSAHTNGAIVIIVSLSLLLYLALLQAYEIFYVENAGMEDAWLHFINNMFKCTVMIMCMAIVWYFYAIQEYRTVVNELMDLFSVSKQDDKVSYPYSKNHSLALIVDSASGVVKNNKMYRLQLDNQKKLLLNNYIMRLMKGRVKDIPAAYESGEALGVNLHADGLQVVVFGLSESNETILSDEMADAVYDTVRFLIQNMLLAVFDGYLTEVDGLMACLLVSQSEEKLNSRDSVTELKRIATLIQQIVQDKNEQMVRVTAGSVSVGIAGIEKSFSEAMELFQYAEIIKEDSGIMVYREVPTLHTVDTDDYFWFKKEMQFMNCINTADYTNAATVFYEILDSEYINSDMPLKLINCRMLGLINSMINALGKIRLTVDGDFFERLDPWNTILNCKSIPELKKRSEEIFNCINNYTENQKRQSSYSRMTEIVEYLKENYDDPNLSVTSAAEYFQLNPSYLSRSFKKLMGIGFSDYLQWVRVEAAEELLKNKRLSIREVAEMVGCSGVQTLNRAFKKFKGTTAGKIRNMDEEEAN